MKDNDTPLNSLLLLNVTLCYTKYASFFYRSKIEKKKTRNVTAVQE